MGLDEAGLPAFNSLQNSGDLRLQPLEMRRELLREVVAAIGEPVRFSEAFDAPATALMALVKEKGLEGVVAKCRGSTYQAGKRSDDWIKVRTNRSGEFIIGGYVPVRGIDAILVGYRDAGRPPYAGFIRAGFVAGVKRGLLARMEAMLVKRCPFVNLPDQTRGRWGEGMTAERMRLCRWGGAAPGREYRISRVDAGEEATPSAIRGTLGRGKS